jgi:hypothetical protein
LDHCQRCDRSLRHLGIWSFAVKTSSAKGAKAMHKFGAAIQRELAETKAKLAEAEWLIRELDGHEGAEGWSEYLQKRLDAYQFSTTPEQK